MSPNINPCGLASLLAILSPEPGCAVLELTDALSRAMAQTGQRVLVIDADEGRLLRRANITPAASLTDVRDERAKISDAKYVTPDGRTLCCAGPAGLDELLGITAALSLSYDMAIVLPPEGCTPAHTRLAAAADHCLINFDAGGDKFMRAYWMLDAIRARAPRFDPQFIAWGEKDEAREAYSLLTGTIREFLGGPPRLAAISPRRSPSAQAISDLMRLYAPQNHAAALNA